MATFLVAKPRDPSQPRSEVSTTRDVGTSPTPIGCDEEGVLPVRCFFFPQTHIHRLIMSHTSDPPGLGDMLQDTRPVLP